MKIFPLIFVFSFALVFLFRTLKNGVLSREDTIFFKVLFWEAAIAAFWGIVVLLVFWAFITFQYHIGAIKVL